MSDAFYVNTSPDKKKRSSELSNIIGGYLDVENKPVDMHYGPGQHPSGSGQDAHGGGEGGGESKGDSHYPDWKKYKGGTFLGERKEDGKMYPVYEVEDASNIIDWEGKESGEDLTAVNFKRTIYAVAVQGENEGKVLAENRGLSHSQLIYTLDESDNVDNWVRYSLRYNKGNPQLQTYIYQFDIKNYVSRVDAIYDANDTLKKLGADKGIKVKIISDEDKKKTPSFETSLSSPIPARILTALIELHYGPDKHGEDADEQE